MTVSVRRSDPLPVHCRPTHDCRDWAWDTRRALDRSGHAKWLHETRDQMDDSLERWLSSSFTTIRGTRSIGPILLPNPSDPDGQLSVGAVDPTTVVVVLAFTVLTGRDATGAYIGLVGQDPNSLWRGLTGFFVAWCHGCDAGGRRSMKALRRRLESHGVDMRSIYQMPQALSPRGAWFGASQEGARLRWGGLINADADLTAYWEPYAPDAGTGPAVVSIGPAQTNLANLVLVEDLARDSRALERLAGGPRAGWRQRLGALDRLEELMGLGYEHDPVQARSARDVGRLPATWGSYLEPQTHQWIGPVRNLKEAALLLPRTRVPLSVRLLPANKASRLSDILSLPLPS